MSRLLVLAKYGLEAASTRYRFALYFPALRAAGFEPELSPLLDDSYVRALSGAGPVSGGRHAYARGFARRVRDLVRAGGYSAALLNYEAFPYLPLLYEHLLALRVPIVFDIDDAIFHRYDLSPWLRPFLGGKIAGAAGLSRVAIAGNEYLAAHLRARARDVRVIPTIVDTAAYTVVPPRAGEVPVIGWIGSPSTSVYLRAILPVLREVLDGGKRARLVVVGAGGAGKVLAGDGVELRQWSEANEVRDVQSFDIGLMPLPDDPWSRGKCGFKLIQYMACGRPVVASPVGVNASIVSEGTGYLVSGAEEWKRALLRLVESSALRAEFGARARERAVAEYSLVRWQGEFVRAVRDACGR
jgi:glycosyltransferase involved in cell wall biosynthesis